MPGERFSVRLVDENGSTDRVTVEVGLEGFNILNSSGRILRKYPLHHISRWSMRGTSLILFTKSPVDVEDRTVTLEGDEFTIRSVLDTLTCSCMQMAELLQSGQGPEGAGQAAATSLNMLLKKSKKPTLLTADQVEFWRQPEKAGWMHSQGEHIKTWRKRWFVLKQGFLFRFASADLNSGSKPRGIVDLSQVTDVASGVDATGKPNSIKLSTAGGHTCYLTDSETAQVEWISALEGAVAKIVKLVAGVDEEEDGAGAAGGGFGRGGGGGGSGETAGKSSAKSWAEQLERSFAASGEGAGGPFPGAARRSSGSSNRNTISVIGYGGGGSGGGSQQAGQSRAGVSGGRQGSYDDYGYVKVDFGGGIAGAQTLPDRREPSRQPTFAGSGGGGGGGGYPNPSSYGHPNGQAAYQTHTHPSPSAGYPPPAYPPAQQAPPPEQQYGQQEVAPPYGGHGAQQAPYPQQGGGASSLMDSVTTPQVPPPANNPWQTHYTADGRTYYHNTATGITQWEPPQAY